ncbi:MAG: TonB-dependent receptor [Bacteriodetes bacterium]|nr:TonB-dependent receptor [Bacteroidota bacterium]
MNKLYIYVFVLIVTVAHAQQPSGTLRGVVTNTHSQQTIAGVTVKLLSTKLGAITNSKGEYTIKNIPVGTYSVQFSSVGFEQKTQADVVIRSGRSTVTDVSLKEQATSSDAVTVQADYFSANDATVGSAMEYSSEEIRRAPGSAGDINRVLTSSPSIGRVDDSRADIVVRGGSPAENSFLIDNIPVYNINYFPKQGASGGPISFINIAQVRSMNFRTGGYDASFNALSSVVDISLKDGNSEHFAAQADLNMIGVGGMIEGPLGNGSSYYVSVSRGYLDALKDMLGQTGVPQWANIQGKITLNAGADDKIGIIAFSALSDFKRDKTEALGTNTSVNNNQQWQNIYGANWKHIYGTTGYANTSLSFNSIHGFEWARFPQNDSMFMDNDYTQQAIHLRHVSHFVHSTQIESEIGFDTRYELNNLSAFVAAHVDSTSTFIQSQYVRNTPNMFRYDAFASLIATLFDKLHTSVGMRAEQSMYSENRTLAIQVLPRVSLQYNISNDVTISACWGKFTQALPLALLQYAINNTFPTKPIIATHVVASLGWIVSSDTRVTVEAYKKDYNNMPIDIAEPTRSPLDDAVSDFEYKQTTHYRFNGTARSYGIELALQKKMSSDIYATIGSSMNRSFYTDGNGVERSRLYDNRYLLNATIGWKISDSWEVGGQFAMMGGNAYSPINDSLSKLRGVEVVNNSEVMMSHLPAYTTFNLRVDKRFNFEQSNIIVYLTALNALNLQNTKTIEWNPYSKTVITTQHIGILPVLGVEWQM